MPVHRPWLGLIRQRSFALGFFGFLVVGAVACVIIAWPSHVIFWMTLLALLAIGVRIDIAIWCAETEKRVPPPEAVGSSVTGATVLLSLATGCLVCGTVGMIPHKLGKGLQFVTVVAGCWLLWATATMVLGTWLTPLRDDRGWSPPRVEMFQIAVKAIPFRKIAHGLIFPPLFVLEVVLLFPVFAALAASWILAELALPAAVATINLVGASSLLKALRGPGSCERNGAVIASLVHAVRPGLVLGSVFASATVWGGGARSILGL